MYISPLQRFATMDDPSQPHAATQQHPPRSGSPLMRVSLRAFLFQGTQNAGAAAEHLRAIGALKLSPEEQFEHDHLYDCLSILDGKAAALLQFDSILIATSTIVLSLLKAGANAASIAVAIALILATVSSATTLVVITLFWTEASELKTPRDYLSHLLGVRDRRTVYYRLAWLTALMSLLALVIGAILSRAL
jgi:hypothetical protein